MSVKEHIWQSLAAVTRLVPASLLKQCCDLVFASRQQDSHAGEHLKTLLEIQSRLRWYTDQQAIRYEGGAHPKHRLTDYHRFFTERVEPEDRVLDIGCGQGMLAASIADKVASVTGVDIVQGSIERAIANYSRENVEFLLCDVTRELPEREYSVIIMSNVLEHLAIRAELLRSLNTRYSPRCFLIRVPMINRHWEVPLRKELGLPHFSDPTHYTEYTLESFAEEMAASGLGIQYIQVIWGEIWAVLQGLDTTSTPLNGE